MTEPAVMDEIDDASDSIADGADASFIPLSDPDITAAELEAVEAALRSPRLSSGPTVEAFEAAFRGLSRPQICGCGPERHDRAC